LADDAAFSATALVSLQRLRTAPNRPPSGAANATLSQGNKKPRPGTKSTKLWYRFHSQTAAAGFVQHLRESVQPRQQFLEFHQTALLRVIFITIYW
jgi:hypothetical protein